MNISILLGPYFPFPPIKGGAVEKLSNVLARQFITDGHKVNILSRSWPDLPAKEELAGIRVYRRAGFDQTKSKYQILLKDFQYARQWLKNVPESDVILVHDLLFAFFSQFTNFRPKVVYCLGRTPAKHLTLFSKITAFTTPSKATEEKLLFYLPKNKGLIKTIGHPLDLNTYYPETTKSITSNFIYVGRIHPEKGIHLLVKAFLELLNHEPESRLTIIGPSAESEGGGGEKYLGSLNIDRSKNIEHLGPIYDQKLLREHLSQNSFFCYPSLAENGETFGLAVLEAMASGCIPIVSDLECFKDYLVDGKNGLVFNHRASIAEASLAKVLRDAINNASTDSMKVNAIETADLYSAAKIANDYYELFAKMGISFEA